MKSKIVVRVRNTRHSHSFLSSIRDFWNNNCYSNAILLGRNPGRPGFTSLPVNKSILAAISHQFAGLLANTENDVSLIFPDTGIVILEHLVKFAYEGQIIMNANERSSMIPQLKSFFSEWGIHFPDEASTFPCDNNHEKNSICEKSMDNQHSLNPSKEPLSYQKPRTEPSIPTKPKERTGNFEKLFSKTYARKNKLVESPVKKISVLATAGCSEANKSNDLKAQTEVSLSENFRDQVNKKNHLEETANICTRVENSVNCQEIEIVASNENLQGGANLSRKPEAIVPDGKSDDRDYLRQEPKVVLPDDIEDEAQENEESMNERSHSLFTKTVDRFKANSSDLPESDKNPIEVPSAKRKRVLCSICGKEVSADYLANHTKLHAQLRSHLCMLCGASFILSDRLRKHMKFVHRDKSQPPTHICKVCGKSFTHKRYLKNHEMLHTGLKPYKCPYCDKSFRLSTVLYKHKRVHTGEKPYECNICWKRFAARSTYVDHARRHERTVPASANSSEAANCYDQQTAFYKCNLCGLAFRQVVSFSRHMAKHRGEEPKLPCKHCSETFPNRKLVGLHMREKHADTLFKCEECLTFFASLPALKNHMVIHKEGYTPSRCVHCGRTFQTRDELKTHQDSTHVNDSRQMHASLQNGGPHQCTYCSKAFKHRNHLMNHIRIHTGEKPFLCSVCGKAFNTKNNLSCHMKIHTCKKNQCIACGEVFRSIVKLKEHEKTHSVEEQPSSNGLTNSEMPQSQSQ